jgi:hypothetical protein
MRLLALLAVSLLAIVGCGDDDDAPSSIELTRSGGCGEAYLWAATDDGTTVVTVSVEVPRWSTIDPVEIDVDLADGDGEGRLLRGDVDLTGNMCTDSIDGNAEPHTTTPLVEGTGEVVIGPIPTDVDLCGQATGTLDLADVVADDGTRIATVRAESDDVGCYSG